MKKKKKIKKFEKIFGFFSILKGPESGKEKNRKSGLRPRHIFVLVMSEANLLSMKGKQCLWHVVIRKCLLFSNLNASCTQ